MYIWYEEDIYYIVKLEVEKMTGYVNRGLGPKVEGYESKLIDIFTKKTIYKKLSISLIDKEQIVLEENNYRKYHYGYLFTISEKARELLVYTDKQVPLYVLQRLYYKLNKVNLSSPLLEEPKIKKLEK